MRHKKNPSDPAITTIIYIFLLTFQQRNELSKDMSKEMVSSAIVEGNATIKSKKQLSQIIDTTLLKCYIQVGDYLIP